MKKKGKKKWIVLGVIVILACVAAIKSKITENAEYQGFQWPNTALAQKLPDPEAKWGKIQFDSADYLDIDIAKADHKTFETYYTKCADKGFNVNYNRSDTDYDADDKDGYHLSVFLDKDKKVMNIMLSAPVEDDATDEKPENDLEVQADSKEDAENISNANTDTQTETTNDSEPEVQAMGDGSVRTEIKEALDSYEVFMNEYVDFMEKYNDSDDTASMLVDYTNYMKKYAEMCQKMDDIENMELNDAEALYLLEVQTRINARLLEIQ